MVFAKNLSSFCNKFLWEKRSEGMNFQLQTRSRWIITLPFLPNGDVHDAPNSAHAEIKPHGAKSTEVDHRDMKVKEAAFRANAKVTIDFVAA
jgi:hypothetical protein